MAVVWVTCTVCKGARMWMVNGKLVICSPCGGLGGEIREV